MVTLKWPSISERRSPTEKLAKCVDLDRTGRLANGMTELTIRNPSTLDGTKSGYISGDRDGNLKWPSISERRSPTEQASSHIDLDRTRMPSIGLIERTIQIPRNWTTQSRATSLGQRWLL